MIPRIYFVIGLVLWSVLSSLCVSGLAQYAPSKDCGGPTICNIDCQILLTGVCRGGCKLTTGCVDCSCSKVAVQEFEIATCECGLPPEPVEP